VSARALAPGARDVTLPAVVLGSSVVFLDSSIVNVALDAIGRDLPTTVLGKLEGLTYVSSGYLATLAALLILAGALGDRYGRRRLFRIGLAGFGIASLACGMAPTMEVLVVARLVQGAMGALLVPGALAIITARWDGEARGRAIGIWASSTSAIIIVGPLIGGLLPGWIGIRGTFFAGGAVIAVAALLTVFVVKEDFEPATDTKREAASTAAADGAPRTCYAVIGALLATAMMVLLANMSIEPVITVYVGSLGVAPDHLARIAGVVMACSAFGSMFTAARLGALADRVGGWNVIIGCLVVTGLVMIPQAFVEQWWQLAALRALMGMSLAGLLPAIAKLARHAVDESRTGQMLGYLQSAQFSGQVLGPVIGGQIAVHLGMHSVFFATGSLLVVCAGFAQWARGR